MKHDLFFALCGAIAAVCVGTIVYTLVEPQPNIVIVPVDTCDVAEELRGLMPNDENHSGVGLDL